MVGNFALLVLMVLIVQKGTFSLLDIVFWTVVATVLFIRYADIKWLKGIGPDLQPATMKDWARYARLLFLIAGGVWAIAHALLLLLRR
jgi:predicted alpha/beta hydrolase